MRSCSNRGLGLIPFLAVLALVGCRQAGADGGTGRGQGSADGGSHTGASSESADRATDSQGDRWMSYVKPSDQELRERLTNVQYQVTQKEATEPPFDNAYWNNHEPGIYVDIISGEPLFSSTDKFDSGTGWPSFTKPLEPDNVVKVKHNGIFGSTNEVRSKHADSHLGDVFDDGPPPTGLRYCIDSAALRFIPKAELEKEGYGEYLPLFK
jgi:methionine-R-sulfoxide reductase